MYNELAYSSSSITVVNLQYLQNFSYIYSIGIPDSHNYSCKPTKSRHIIPSVKKCLTI